MAGGRIQIVAVSAAIAATLAAPSLAAGALSYKTVNINLLNGNSGGNITGCDGGSAVGGGMYTAGAFNEVELTTSAPFAGGGDDRPDDGWFGLARNFGGEQEEAAVISICSGGTVEYAQKAAVTNVVQKVARCPGDTYPAGGGMSNQGIYSDGTRLVSSAPWDGGDRGYAPDAWIGSSVSAGMSGWDIPATVSATCIKRKPAYRKSQFVLPPGTSDGETRLCRSDERVTGGGVLQSTPEGPFSAMAGLSALYPTDSSADGDQDPDDGFAVIASNTDATDELTIKLWAVCV